MVTTIGVTLRAFLLPLTRALRDTGWTVDALTHDDGTSLDGDFDAVHEIGWTRSPLSLLRVQRFAREIRELVEHEEYDVVHVHTPIAAFVTRLALAEMRERDGQGGVYRPCWANKPRIIYTAHGLHFYKGAGISAFAYRAAERLVIHGTDTLVVMNDEDEVAGANLCALTVGSERVCELRRIDGMGFDFAAFGTAAAAADGAAIRAERGIDADAFVVGVIAELSANKRHRLVLDAVRLLKERSEREHRKHAQRTAPVRFVFIGSGPLERRLRAYVRQHNLADSVHFTGAVPFADIPALCVACDLGLLVSKREGLPRSLMEFVAASVPIVGTRTRGITDEVRNANALCEPTPEALADLIEHWATATPQERTTLAATQHSHALAHYDTSVVIPQYLELYQQ